MIEDTSILVKSAVNAQRILSLILRLLAEDKNFFQIAKINQ